MPVDAALLERLLLESEGDALDFKRAPYPFEGASDEAKGELLKDLLAFANAWRRADAYIVIGADETARRADGRAAVLDVTAHPDDASLQQFINTKTNRRLHFSYQAVRYEGQSVGVYHVPRQERPVYLRKSYGRVRADVVYYRRGSETAVATPDEVARMGRDDAEAARPVPYLELAVYDPRAGRPVGTRVSVTSTVLTTPPLERLLRPPDRSPGFAVSLTNPDYPHEVAAYMARDHLLQRFQLALRNVAAVSADDARVIVRGPADPEVVVLDEADFPDVPRALVVGTPPAFGYAPAPDVTVRRGPDGWTVDASFGRVVPGADAVTRRGFYIGATADRDVAAEATIYAHDLPPVTTPVTFAVTAHPRAMTPADLAAFRAR